MDIYTLRAFRDELRKLAAPTSFLPAARRVLSGAAMGGVAGGLGGAALDRENRGRGALLGGAGGALLGAGAGHLANRAVSKAVGQASAQSASEVGALKNRLSDLAESQKMPATESMRRMLGRDYKLDVPTKMTDETHAKFLQDLTRAVHGDERRTVHSMLNSRQEHLGDALRAGNTSEAQEHHTRLAELIGRLQQP